MWTVYGTGKMKLVAAVEKRVRDQVRDIGIVVERIYLIGQLRLPTTVTTALNAKIEATQKAAQRENEVAQSKAEADKVIEEARGTAESRLAIARAEAEAIRLQGAALRENPQVLQLRGVEAWDGVLPRFVGGEGPIPFIDVGTQRQRQQ